MVTVTATAAQGADTLLLQVGAYNFQTLQVADSAFMIKATAALGALVAS